jgi:hypothetical protein
MTDMEAQLSKLFTLAAGDPPRRVSAESVHQAVARRRATWSVAAAAAVVLVAGAGVAVAGQVHGRGHASGPGLPPGVPRYYIEQGFGGVPSHLQTLVRSTASGAVTAQVHCPGPGPRSGPRWLAAADGQAFFVTCEKPMGPRPGGPVRLYRFQVTRSGSISGYSLVRGGTLTGVWVGDIAVTPDGSLIAVQAFTRRTTVAGPEVIIIDTKTGGHTVWRPARVRPGGAAYPVDELSLTGNGQELVYLASHQCIRRRHVQPPPCRVSSEIRALTLVPGGGSLARSRVLLNQSQVKGLSLSFIYAGVITPDGSAVTLAVLGNGPGTNSSSVSVQQYSATTGRLQRVVFRMRTGNGYTYGPFAADASGRHFIIDAGRIGRPVNGWIDHGRLVRLRPQGVQLQWEAW